MKQPGKKAGLYQLIDGATKLRPPDLSREPLPAPLSLKTDRSEQLSDVLQREVCIDWRRVCALTIDVCSRLSATHRSGVPHGKLDPSKIVADNEQGRLRNARIINPSLLSMSALSDDKSWDRTAFPYFSADHFLSPEQKAGKKPSTASDIYALGALMYTALTGSPPEPPETQLNPFKRKKNLHSKLSAYGVPPQLETIVLRCLKPNPRDRYKNSDDLRSVIAWWDPWLDRGNKRDLRNFIPPVGRSGLIASAILAFIGILAMLVLNSSNTSLAKHPGDGNGLSITIMFGPGQCSIKTKSPAPNSETELLADED